MNLRTLFLAFCVACTFSSCAATGETASSPSKPNKPKLHNPGDELSERPWGQGNRASHYATPFGLPMSQ